MRQTKTRRRRGVLLTNVGVQRLQAAILAVEMVENNGSRFSLEELSDRVKVSTKTLSRLWSLNASVDQKTLKLCFSAFNLELYSEDYTIGDVYKLDSLGLIGYEGSCIFPRCELYRAYFEKQLSKSA